MDIAQQPMQVLQGAPYVEKLDWSIVSQCPSPCYIKTNTFQITAALICKNIQLWNK